MVSNNGCNLAMQKFVWNSNLKLCMDVDWKFRRVRIFGKHDGILKSTATVKLFEKRSNNIGLIKNLY